RHDPHDFDLHDEECNHERCDQAEQDHNPCDQNGAVRPGGEFVGFQVCRLLHLVHQVGHNLPCLLQISVDPAAHNVHGLFPVGSQGSSADGACTGCGSIEHGLCRFNLVSATGIPL